MTEKDKEIQLLRKRLEVLSEENDALMGELYALHECSTCVHNDEPGHCRPILHSKWCPKEDGYKWRGVQAYNDWAEDQRNRELAEARINVEAEAEEYTFERGLKE